MRPVSVGEADPVVLCQLEATARVCIGHNLGARYSVRIELVIPRRVERIGPVHPLAIATDLYHLRTACICLTVWVRRAADNAADVDRARKLRLSGVGDVVLTHLAGSPASDIQKLIVHGQVDVSYQRRNGAEALQKRWQLILIRRLRRNRCRLLDVKLSFLAPPSPDRAFEIR